MICSKCGKEIDDDSKFCAKCGAKIEQEENTSSEQANKAVAAASEAYNEVKHIAKGLAEKGFEGYNNLKNISKEEQQEAIEQTKEKAKNFAEKEKENYKNFKNLTTKQKLVRIAVPVLVLVILINIFGGGKLTVKNNNDTGALLNITFKEYTKDFGKNLDKVYKENGFDPIELELSDFWGDSYTDYEDNSGKEFTSTIAFLSGASIKAKEIDGKIQSIDICFDFDNNEFAQVSAINTYMICGDMSFEEANDIYLAITDDMMSNNMVYKDGILYCITFSTVSYTVIAADNDFVESLEESGNCNVLYW